MGTKEFEDKIITLSDRIYPMVARMLGNEQSAEDAVQEIMIKLWERRKKIGDHPNISGFVFLTARNYCLDQLKRKQPTLESSDQELAKLTGYSNQNGFEGKELSEIVENLLKELPNQQSEVLVMRDFDGLEFVEIATAINLKVEHVRVLLSRARKQISRQLEIIYSYESGRIE